MEFAIYLYSLFFRETVDKLEAIIHIKTAFYSYALLIMWRDF